MEPRPFLSGPVSLPPPRRLTWPRHEACNCHWFHCNLCLSGLPSFQFVHFFVIRWWWWCLLGFFVFFAGSSLPWFVFSRCMVPVFAFAESCVLSHWFVLACLPFTAWAPIYSSNVMNVCLINWSLVWGLGWKAGPVSQSSRSLTCSFVRSFKHFDLATKRTFNILPIRVQTNDLFVSTFWLLRVPCSLGPVRSGLG